MTDMVQLQEDLTLRLQSEPLLGRINVVQQRKLRLENQVALDTIWLTPREGRSGCGILVEMPTITVKSANLPGPEHHYGISVVVIEEPLSNFAPDTGTLMQAEEVAERCLEVIQHLFIQDVGQIYAAARAIQEATEFENLIAYRVSGECRRLRTGTARCVEATVTEDSGTITLTAANVLDEVYYTTDESMPGPANPAALVYAAPFSATAGTVVRWASYRAEMLGSNISRATVT